MTCAAGGWKSFGCVALGLAAILHAGCGGSDNRKAVFGTVIGAEGQNGSLSLVPAEGNEGPSAIAEIKNGAFQFDSSTGPSPGPHAAHILLAKEASSAPAATDNPKVAMPSKPALDASPLGKQFTVQVTIPADAPYQVDINLGAGKSSGDNR